jgi:N-methylhydantoinase A
MKGGMSWLGVDVGGTFTDLVWFDRESRRLKILKTPSTPDNQAEGILHGVDRLGLAPPSLDRFIHGTTVATNTALERNGASLAVLTTAGHKDVLIAGRGNRMAMYNIKAPPNRPLLPRSRCIEIGERMLADGTVLRPLDEKQVENAAKGLAEEGIEAVAICFLHAYANPDHERRCAEIVSRHLPGVTVVTSSGVLCEYREYERFSSAALNAYVAPRMRKYVGGLRTRLLSSGCPAPLTIMASNGGALPAQMVEELPVLSMLSGPAAGVIAAAHIGRQAGYPDLITCDMGGTSTDVCLIKGGDYSMTTEGKVGAFPIKIRQIDINTIAAGGGSIAACSQGGFLTVGPRSAGAFPGPASYGRGGTEPTISDANIVLGRLRTDRLLGGEIKLDERAAFETVGRLAKLANLDTIGMAEGIIRIATVALAGAIKEVSVMRGIDPRDFALLPFGGAGPLHAADVADELGMKTVIVPPFPGNFSALGLLIADLRRDYVRTRLSRTADTSIEDVRSQLNQLAEAGESELAEAGIEPARRHYAASLDMRYAGQSFELPVPCPADVKDMKTIERGFAEIYAARYGATTKAPVEIVSYRVAAFGISEKPVLPVPRASDGSISSAQRATAEIIFGGKCLPAPVYARDLLPPDASLEGPALIEEDGSSTIIPPGWSAAVEQSGCLVLRRK